MSGWPAEIEHRARALIAAFSERRLMVATAESCTGGLIVGALTEVSGSSSVVDRGFVTYSNDAKIQMLGVDPATLATHGAVSRQTAVEKAESVHEGCAGFALAVGGVAGIEIGGKPARPEPPRPYRSRRAEIDPPIVDVEHNFGPRSAERDGKRRLARKPIGIDPDGRRAGLRQRRRHQIDSVVVATVGQQEDLIARRHRSLGCASGC